MPIAFRLPATDTISQGDYDVQIDVVASDEIGVLVDSFKRMTPDRISLRHRLNQADETLSLADELLEQKRQSIEAVLEERKYRSADHRTGAQVSMFNGAAQLSWKMSAEARSQDYRHIFEFHKLRNTQTDRADGGRRLRAWRRNPADGRPQGP